jgi:hypothetical protein
MQQEATNLPTPLEYAAPTLSTRPLRLWVLAAFAFALVVFEGFQPRLTPPGWPTTFDYALMLLLPLGAGVMAIGTSLPGWLLGLYGLFGSMMFLQGQFTDTRLHFRLETPAEIRSFLVNWSAFIVGSWAVCRSAVLLRRLPRVRRRLFRFLFSLAASVSLVLCGASVVLWVRSHFATDSLICDGDPIYFYLWSGHGQLDVETAELPSPPGPRLFSVALDVSDRSLRRFFRDQPRFRIAGFEALPGEYYVIPFWALTLVLAAGPACLLPRTIRAVRYRSPAECPKFGYDLRATPERCPECGSIPEPAATATAATPAR